MLRLFWAALGWMVLPLTAGILATSCYQFCNFGGGDPRAWDFVAGLILAGPLIGYGFLAGATSCLADPPARRRWHDLLFRRAVWVGIGPWAVFLIWMALFFTADRVSRIWSLPTSSDLGVPADVMVWVVLGTTAYGWLIAAVAAVVRARRSRHLARALTRGVALAGGFVGSLLGTFWAITSAWRAYFFDPTVLRAVLFLLICAGLCSGCGPVTAGELRRRELFDALLLAWVIGLALAWRWLSRPRR
jgi:hypothetical protein